MSLGRFSTLAVRVAKANVQLVTLSTAALAFTIG
jgi:hypothetical protein